jgi:LacI family transcriptional regulator
MEIDGKELYMASIKDVAKLAGVGLGTASRVINNKGSVKPTTREKVLRAIRELNYTPNEVARSFQSQSSKLVGLIIPTVWHPFFSELTYYVENELYKRGYKMMLCNSDAEANKEIDYLEMLKRHQVAGIIAITYSDFTGFGTIDLPMVSIDRYINDKIPHVASNNYEGGKKAAEALIKGGAQKLAYVGGIPLFKSSVSERKKALIEVAKKHNRPYVVHETLPSDNQIDLTVKEFLKLYPDVDGVFTSTDLFAGALIKELNNQGKKVPEDVQVVGFDGIQNNDFFKPILSTVVQPVEGIGRKSVEILLNLIDKKEITYETILDVSYRKGDTTK